LSAKNKDKNTHENCTASVKSTFSKLSLNLLL